MAEELAKHFIFHRHIAFASKAKRPLHLI
jgi:hypothetical protein